MKYTSEKALTSVWISPHGKNQKSICLLKRHFHVWGGGGVGVGEGFIIDFASVDFLPYHVFSHNFRPQ